MFSSNALWLEVAVRPGDSLAAYTTLLPRQAVTAAPYASALPGLWTLNNNTSPNVVGGWKANNVTTGVVGATLAGGGSPDVGRAPRPNVITDHYGTVSGGTRNRAGDDDATLDNATHATVGGGDGNIASHDYATVGGGSDNSATSTYNTIAGGRLNSTSYARTTIGGGQGNTAAGDSSTIGGGRDNTTGGIAATVPGGWQNAATGDYSFAAGRRAKANHPGSFVWADSTDADFQSTGNNQLLIRAGGGVGIGTALPTSPLTVAGVVESASGGFKFKISISCLTEKLKISFLLPLYSHLPVQALITPTSSRILKERYCILLFFFIL